MDIDDGRLAELAARHGTPLFVYSGSAIRSNYGRIRDAFGYPETRILYAAMANYNPRVMRTAKDLGMGIQIESIGEIGPAENAGFCSDDMSFTSSGTSAGHLGILHNRRVRVAFESLGEIDDYGNAAVGSVDNEFAHGIRISMGGLMVFGSGANGCRDSNIGISPEQVKEARALAKSRGLRLGGVHGYLGSNISDPGCFKAFADYLTKAAEGFDGLEYVNFGSGFALDLDLKEVGGYYSEKMKRLSERMDRKLTLEIEPGRALVGSAGVLLTGVTRVKPLDDGAQQVYVDAGFGEFARPYMYKSERAGYHEIAAVGADSQREVRSHIRAATVLQTDFLGRDRMLPEVRPGDILAVKDAGAYAMASGFPRPRPISKSVFLK